MPHIPCKQCAGTFYSKPSWIERGVGKYCSIECASQARKTGKTVNCFICGQETYKPQKELKKSQSKKFFCGMKCSLAWHNSLFVGKKHPNWKHGEYAYREIMKRSSRPQVCKLCETKNKNVIIVHHLDKNRKNNILKNLAWLCRNCHFLVHNYEDENKRFLKNI